MTHPLAGIRVADFTLHAAGPFCTHQLSQLGAEVIKIETRDRPDIFRKPHPVYGRLGAATFDQVASNKRSITINLKNPQGLEVAKRLVAVSDVVAESFRPGVMERLGLSYDVLRAIRPDIVMVSVSASGQTGPERTHAGYAPLFGAAGGLGTLTGYEDGPPTEIRHAMDHSTGLNTTAATLAALYRRKRTGQGCHVDVAAREVASAFIGDALLEQAAGAHSPGRRGNDDPAFAPHGVYPCAEADTWVSIAVKTDDEWRRLAQATGHPQWAGDPRFADFASRRANRAQIDEQLAVWTRGHPAAQVFETLQAAGVAAVPAWTSQDLIDDPHLQARGVVQHFAGPEGNARSVVGPSWRFSRTPASLDRWTPDLGEANDYVLRSVLGLSAEQIEQLEAAGALR
jgi:crotonobetainyl-CoA:carnitine CoA-transferase CaiB-like acyl-CoA transferase